MSSKFDHTGKALNGKAIEDDKYMQVFKHLEAVNLKNKAAFDELLRYTYSNIKDTPSGGTDHEDHS